MTQAQRDLVQAQVNVLQAQLDHQSAIVNFEAVQHAPGFLDAPASGFSGSSVSPLTPAAPQGIFRAGGGEKNSGLEKSESRLGYARYAGYVRYARDDAFADACERQR